MKIEEIIQIMEGMKANGLTSFEMTDGAFRLSLGKEAVAVSVATPAPVVAAVPAAAEQTASVPVSSEPAAGEEVQTSPLVGIFYTASSPDADPFVKVGDTVHKGQVIGIIEAMKLMNEIECEYDGVVTEILVKNEDVVEFAQPLLRIKKA